MTLLNLLILSLKAPIPRFMGFSQGYKTIYSTLHSLAPTSGGSERVHNTDTPIVTHMRKLMLVNPQALSLAQGIVYWSPPKEALQKLTDQINETYIHGYCSNYGLPDLRNLIKEKLKRQGIINSEVMVTSGANQGFTNIVLTLIDPSDKSVIFKPYYFNHLMAIQMTGGAQSVVIGEVDESLIPDMNWLQTHIQSSPKTKMVVLCNPCNPTGVIYPRHVLTRARDICTAANVWLVIDNTYDLFTYEKETGLSHSCVEGSHVVNLFSMSKAYGMMGWRVGYIAYPPHIDTAMLKVQDTIAICPPVASQLVAMGALETPSSWTRERIDTLAANKRLVMDALSPLFDDDDSDGVLYGGSGAIYLWVKLPSLVTKLSPGLQEWLLSNPLYAEAIREGVLPPPPSLDQAVTDWLGLCWGVLLIPGSSCGMPGHIRACYANLPYEKTLEACERLRKGLGALVSACQRQRSQQGHGHGHMS